VNREFWVKVGLSVLCLVLAVFVSWPFELSFLWFWFFKLGLLFCLLVGVWVFYPFLARRRLALRSGLGGARLSGVELRRRAWFEFELSAVRYLKSSGYFLDLVVLPEEFVGVGVLRKPGLADEFKRVSLAVDGLYSSLSSRGSLVELERLDSVFGFSREEKRKLRELLRRSSGVEENEN